MNSTSAADASTQAVFPSILTLPLVGTKLRVRLTTGCFPGMTSMFRPCKTQRRFQEGPGLVSLSRGHRLQRLGALQPRCGGGARDRRPGLPGASQRRQRDAGPAGEGAGGAAPQGQERADRVEHRARHRDLLDGGRGQGRPRGHAGRPDTGGREPGAGAALRRDAPLLRLGGAADHAQRALPPAGGGDAVDGPADGHLRDPHPRRRPLGREGHRHRQRADRLHPALPGAVGVEPLVRGPRHRAGVVALQGVRGPARPPGYPSCSTAGPSSPN